MSLVTNWDGSIQVPANSSKERTTQLGTFVGINKITTYYPLPSAYVDLIPIVSLYKVPPKYTARPDLIALDLYKDAALWWVIFWANKIVDPFARPSSGEIINVIDITSLQKLLS